MSGALIRIEGKKRASYDLDWLLRWVIPEPNSGCWLWGGSLNKGGYGTVGFRGRSMNAFKVAWQLAGRDIPGGYDLDHKCRVRCCVNPDHLEPVTRATNVLRGLRPSQMANRHTATTHCPNGHPYSGGNLYTHPKRGHRDCITCQRERVRAWRRRQKEKNNVQ